jgi:hypothetical protein
VLDEALGCHCGSNVFQLADGFDVTADASADVETSWFALAARCASTTTKLRRNSCRRESKAGSEGCSLYR